MRSSRPMTVEPQRYWINTAPATPGDEPVFAFDSEAEARAFAAGIATVNDSSLTVLEELYFETASGKYQAHVLDADGEGEPEEAA